MTAEFLKGTSIFLVGMMGSGKSTVGRCLAKKLGYRFIDTDAIIEQVAGQSISEIFAEQGEGEFRALETRVLAGVTPYTRTVIATGGGAVVRQENWGYLQAGLVVWLDVPVEELVVRLSRDRTRPLLQEGDLTAKLTTLLKERRDRYRQADAQIVYQSGETASAIAARTLDTLAQIVAENPPVSATIQRS